MWSLRGQDSAFSPDCFRILVLGQSGIRFYFKALFTWWIDRRLNTLQMKKPGQDTSVEQFFLPHLLLWWVFTPISQPSRITSVRLVRRFLQCWQIFHLLFKKNQKKHPNKKKKKFNSLHIPGTHGALIIPVQVHISSLMGNKRVKERGDENHSSL